MKTFLKSILIIFSLITFLGQNVFASECKILVLPDNIQFDSTNYLVYPDSSVIFASDTINSLKKTGLIETVSMTEIRDALRKNPRLNLQTKKALKEFKYNYNIPFVDITEIAKHFNTNMVLLITSQTDVQNYILKRTIWDILNVPGAAVVNPTYKLSTYVAFIDVDQEKVIWQSTFYKNIAALDSRIIAQSFAPATEQLELIKEYSMNSISLNISKAIQSKVISPLDPTQVNIITVTDQKKLDTSVEIPEELNFKQKIIIPNNVKQNGYGAIVNDL